MGRVRQELKTALQTLEFFWKRGIRGADFFISAIGPALSVFGKYGRVTKLSGEEVTVDSSSTKCGASYGLRLGEDSQDHAHRHHRSRKPLLRCPGMVLRRCQGTRR